MQEKTVEALKIVMEAACDPLESQYDLMECLHAIAKASTATIQNIADELKILPEKI